MRKLGLILSFVVAALGCGDDGADCATPSIAQGVVGHGREFFAEDEGFTEPLTGEVIRAFEGGLDADGEPEGELVLASEPTDECGLFQLALEPGDYSLCGRDCDADPCVEVTVPTGTVEYDLIVDLGNCSWRPVR